MGEKKYVSINEKKYVLVDLSVPISHRAKSEPKPARIIYSSHKNGTKMAEPAGVKSEDFPDGIGLASEELTLITHVGTHLDAPYHFGPTVEGKPAKTIDQVPLKWCIGNGIVLDLTHKEENAPISELDIRNAIDKTRYEIQPWDIVLIRTGRDKLWGSRDYPWVHPGMTREATLHLLNKGVKIIGTDAYGFDRPFTVMFKETQEGTKSALWPAHFTGRDKEYLHIEKLANLDKLPSHGFIFMAFPILIKGASAGWIRAVALVPKE
ncbi:MAG: cyclase family protein [Candidatus Helarchaeota archaeon]|nr:cyclase family protein [Candidatus Helarchaeota archaeon]